MLLVYLDESGIGDAKNEKYVVIAGVVVQAEQYKGVVSRIDAIRDKYVPEKYRKGFVFHANEMFQGGERRISRDEFPMEQRQGALEELISIVSELHLPVVLAHHERQVVREHNPSLNEQEAVALTQAIAAMSCTLLVESFVQKNALASTLALLIYENNDQARGLVKTMHKKMQTGANLERLTDPKDIERVGRVIPLRRVIDTAHFAEKDEAPILQLADVCAYFIRRRLAGRMDSQRFLDRIMNQITTNAHGLWPMGKFGED